MRWRSEKKRKWGEQEQKGWGQQTEGTGRKEPDIARCRGGYQ